MKQSLLELLNEILNQAEFTKIELKLDNQTCFSVDLSFLNAVQPEKRKHKEEQPVHAEKHKTLKDLLHETDEAINEEIEVMEDPKNIKPEPEVEVGEPEE